MPPNKDQLRSGLAYYAAHLSPADVDTLVQRMDGWNFRRLERFAEDAVRRFVSGLDLAMLEASEPPLPGVEDYLAAL